MQSDLERPALKSILFADLAQFSRLTAAGEDQTLDFISRCFGMFRAHCAAYDAEFVKTTGDGVLVLFDAVSSAIDYAMTIQQQLAAFAKDQPVAGQFRIGIHMGELRHRGGDVYGHAVNIAARVQTQASPGGVCVTQEVYRAARGATRFGFRFAGRPALKNMPELVTLYDVTDPESAVHGAAQRWRISVIDGLAISGSDGQPVPLRSHKAQALIGYLALASGFRDAQDRIAALLWPERGLIEARHALADCLRVARKAIADDSSDTNLKRGNLAHLDPARVEVDVVRILGDLDEGKIDDILLSRNDWAQAILRGFEDVSSLFAAWLRVTRHNRNDRAQQALEDMLVRFDIAEPAIRRAATALLVLDPAHEGAARTLIRHHAASQNMAAAMRVFESLRDVLRDRYGLEPSGETQALAASLAAPLPRPERQMPERTRVPAIAIGAFVASAGAIATAFASGFRSELIVNLSKFRELTVIELADGSDEAVADYVVKADCIEADDGFQLAVTLAELGAQRIVWSDAFRLTLANWLSLQKQLVGRIAANLEVYLSHDRLSRALPRLPRDLGVYDAWLRGESLLAHWTPATEDEAERLFEQAIAQDVNFAPAHASLASVYNSRHFIRPGSPRGPETQARALDLAKRAVELDPLDARNHLVMAWSAAMSRRHEQSEVHYDLAADLNPNDPKTLVSAALGLAFMGSADKALRHLERAMSLTSIFLDYQWAHIATTRFLAGDYQGTIEAASRSQNAIIDTPGWAAAALRKLGRGREADAALNDLRQSVAIAWAGRTPPTRADVLTWFLAAFPLRRDRDRRDLAALLAGD